MEFSEVEEAEPVGFIFDPLDREVVSYYLKGMAGDEDLCFPGFIHRLDIYESEPWNLLPSHEFKHGISRNEAFFFTPRHPCSSSTSSSSSKSHVRRTVAGGNGGFWHGKAHDQPIRQAGEVVGRKTSLHFKTNQGIPTDWIMQEYLQVEEKSGTGRGRCCTTFQSVALCKIYKKSNSGSSKSPDHEENMVVEEAAARHILQRLLQDHLQVEEAEPPCKKQRRQLLQQQQHDHVDLEVDQGYSPEVVEASTCWLLPSSGDWNSVSSDIVARGQSAFAPASPGSYAADVITTTPACSIEEIQGLAEASPTSDCSPNEMFSLAELLGDKEEEEEVMVPEAEQEDDLFSFARLLEEELEEEEVVVPPEHDERFPFPAELLREENIITAEDDEFYIDYFCSKIC